MLSRRAFVGRLAAGAAAVSAGAAAVGRASALVREPENPAARPAERDAARLEPPVAAPTEVSAPPPWELLAPLRAGATVGEGWQVTGLSPVVHGAAVLTLADARGRIARVHVCRNDGTPQGLVYTEALDFVVMNGGAGDVPTNEGLAQAVAAVAHAAAANERRVAAVAALQPHAERLERFASSAKLR